MILSNDVKKKLVYAACVSVVRSKYFEGVINDDEYLMNMLKIRQSMLLEGFSILVVDRFFELVHVN